MSNSTVPRDGPVVTCWIGVRTRLELLGPHLAWESRWHREGPSQDELVRDGPGECLATFRVAAALVLDLHLTATLQPLEAPVPLRTSHGPLCVRPCGKPGVKPMQFTR